MSLPADPARPVAWRFDAIGAPWTISTPEPLPADVTAAVARRIDDYDRVWSRFRDDSLVARIAEAPGEYRLPPEAGVLLDLYRRLHDLTSGRVSPLVGRRLEHLGYDRDYSFRVAPGVSTTDPAAVPAWDDAVRWDGKVLSTAAPVLLDVGAAGKGHLVDLVSAILDEDGQSDYVVDASGDLRHRGETPSRVALEHPDDATMAIGVVDIAGRAICASATNRRRWGDGLHHVIDATTGFPTADVVATWAIAPTALEADGLATALFFASPTALAREFDLQAVRVFADGSAEYTTDFTGVLFS